MGSCIHLIDCSQKTVDYVESIFFCLYLHVTLDASGSNWKMTDKHAAEYRKTVCSDSN